MKHTAQLSNRGGWWRLYVALMGIPGSQWPEHDFGPAPVVPTVAARSQVLAEFGYAFTDGAEWEWTEYSETPDDDTSTVRLVASVRVRLLDGGAP
ncbi:DUF6303 family protein [Streptomyces sp. NPDC056231]|uniref:DUF6303 family protein n=1 Tax=Streptomyces sp. NPDC056231 TaxID=3345755 RepID=UPI003AAD7208